MTGDLVHYAADGGVGTLTLDSPHNRNALSARLVAELTGGLLTATGDPGVRAVLLTHTGTVFCSGADLSDSDVGQGAARLLDLLRLVVECPKPVLARLDGGVRAGGLGLVGACDLVVARPSATFAFTEARLGLAAAVISLTTLPRIGERAAARLLLTGETFDGAEAARIGLITQAADDLDAAVTRLLDGVLTCSPQGLAESKRLVTHGVRTALDERGEEMARLSARLFASPEAAEGMLSFFQRRPAPWAVSSAKGTALG